MLPASYQQTQSLFRVSVSFSNFLRLLRIKFGTCIMTEMDKRKSQINKQYELATEVSRIGQTSSSQLAMNQHLPTMNVIKLASFTLVSYPASKGKTDQLCPFSLDIKKHLPSWVSASQLMKIKLASFFLHLSRVNASQLTSKRIQAAIYQLLLYFDSSHHLYHLQFNPEFSSTNSVQ